MRVDWRVRDRRGGSIRAGHRTPNGRRAARRRWLRMTRLRGWTSRCIVGAGAPDRSQRRDVGTRVRVREAVRFSFSIRRASSMPKEPQDLSQARSVGELCRLLRLEPHLLQHMLENPGAFYREARVPKRHNRGMRRIYVVDTGLREVQRQIRDWLGSLPRRSTVATGFGKGDSHVRNAALHVGKLVVCTLDVRDFFDAISSREVSAVLRRVGCKEVVASALTLLTCFNGSLPQGSRSSPILSNLACERLDRDLAALASELGLCVTRYADDITFSGDTEVERETVEKLLSTHGFQARDDSWRTFRKGGPQFVTGMCVADHQTRRVRLPSRYKRWLRLNVHYVRTQGLAEQAEALGLKEDELRTYLRGHLWYAGGVEPAFAEPLSRQLEEVLERGR